MVFLGVRMANRTENTPWQSEVSELLARAAELCVANEVEIDPFVRGATSAYLAANPGMRERLVEMQLIAQIDRMRQAGRLPSA